MQVPCKDCLVDIEEDFSGFFQTKTKCFEMGWHIHKASGKEPGTILERQYIVFMDDDLFDKIYGIDKQSIDMIQ